MLDNVGLTGVGVVAPLAGAWIEISIIAWQVWETIVAPLAGAWIEMLVPFGCMQE